MSDRKEKKKKKKYSYIKKSYSKNGWYSFAIGIAVLLLSTAAIVVSVNNGGEAGMLSGALGFSAIVFAVAGLWFTRLGLMEADRNMLYAKIGGVISFAVLVFWIIIML